MDLLKSTLVQIGYLILPWMLSSCVSHDELINFNRENLVQNSPESIVNAMNIWVQPEDLLRITVHSLDPLAAAPFNLEQEGQNRQMMMGGDNQQLELFTGYFVDQNGMIGFPVLGQIPVKGKTLEDIKVLLVDSLSHYLNDPVVNIRYLNFKVTVLGEVNVPGVLRLTNKRVTLLEALGMAGDLTSYAQRESILVIREMDGVRTYERINLQSDEIFTSPYFYLQQNDLIYVEPLRARVATVADPAQRIISYSSAALSLVTLIIALTR